MNALIFLVFDRSALLEGLGEEAIFWADTNEITAAKQRRSAGDDLTPQAGRGGPERQGTAVPAVAWYVDWNLVHDKAGEFGGPPYSGQSRAKPNQRRVGRCRDYLGRKAA